MRELFIQIRWHPGRPDRPLPLFDSTGIGDMDDSCARLKRICGNGVMRSEANLKYPPAFLPSPADRWCASPGWLQIAQENVDLVAWFPLEEGGQGKDAPTPDAAHGSAGGPPAAGRGGRVPGARGVRGGDGRRRGVSRAHGARRGGQGAQLIHVPPKDRGGGHDCGGVRAGAGNREGAGAQRDQWWVHVIHVWRL